MIESNSNDNVLRKLNVYHNTGIYLYPEIIHVTGSTGNKFYDEINDFENVFEGFGGTDGNDAALSAGVDGLLGFGNGNYILGGEAFSHSWIVEPNLAGWDYTKQSRICMTTEVCDNQILTAAYSKDTSFTFGTSISNQVQPVKWNTATSQFLHYGVDGIDYDSSKKVGEW